MSGPPHHYLPGMSNNQGIRAQFGNNTMQNQMSNVLPGQMNTQLPMQIGNQMGPQILPQIGGSVANQMGGQMNPGIANQMNQVIGQGNQMMGQMNQQYNMNTTHQSSNMQLPQTSMGSMQHHTMQPQVMQQQQQAIVSATPPVQTQQQQQSKEFNTASLCRIGQETVQDVVSRTQEVFQTLKAIQLPNGTPQGSNVSNEKKVKVQEQLRTIRLLFKRLRLIYEKCNENCQLQGMEYTHIESLIPFKDEMDPKHEEKKNSESYRLALDESKEVMEQVVLKNKQLKEVIDHLRRIIWEINTMLMMKRS